MSIFLSKDDREYLCSNELQHPQTRPEKRRAAAFMEKYKKRMMKDAGLLKEVKDLLEKLAKGEVSEKSICDDVDNITSSGNKPSQNS